MLNQQQSITLSYLLGAQTGHDFEAITAKDLANCLQNDTEEAIDMILTAFRVKMGQVVRGTISPVEMITFIDQVAEIKGGLIRVDIEDADIQHEIEIMEAMLQNQSLGSSPRSLLSEAMPTQSAKLCANLA